MSRREKAQSGQELRPRIDFVLPSLAGDGADRVALTLLRDLDQEGFAPLLIPMNRNGPLEDLLSPDIPVVDLARPRLRQALPALLKTLRTGNADIIFSTLGYVNLAVLAMKPLLRGKLVLREANLPSISLKAAPYPRILSRGLCLALPEG